MTRRSRVMINTTGVVIKLEGAIAPDTADREGRLHGATQSKNARADQLVGTDIAQEGNHSSGPGNTGKYV
jgi:hypothetical protein